MLTDITGNGDHYLDIDGPSNVVNGDSSTISVVSSPGGATVIVGEEVNGSFVGFPNNDITTSGGVFIHGKGSRPMVSVSGYTIDFTVSHKAND